MTEWSNTELARKFYHGELKNKTKHGTMHVHHFDGVSFLINSARNKEKLCAMRFPSEGAKFGGGGITFWNRHEEYGTLGRLEFYPPPNTYSVYFDWLTKGTIEDITASNLIALAENSAILNICGQTWLMYHDHKADFLTRDEYLEKAWEGGKMVLSLVDRGTDDFEKAIEKIIPVNGKVYYAGEWFEEQTSDFKAEHLTDEEFSILAHRPSRFQFGHVEVWETSSEYETAVGDWGIIYDKYLKIYGRESWAENNLTPLPGAKYRKYIDNDEKVTHFVKGPYKMGKNKQTFRNWHKTIQIPEKFSL